MMVFWFPDQLRVTEAHGLSVWTPGLRPAVKTCCSGEDHKETEEKQSDHLRLEKTLYSHLFLVCYPESIPHRYGPVIDGLLRDLKVPSQ